MSNNLIVWSPGITLEAIERQVIETAYRHFRQNKTATAQALGISVRTVDTKLEKYLSEKSEEETALERRTAERADQLRRSRGTPPGQDPSNLHSEFSHKTHRRHDMESTSDASSQSAMSMPQRKEIQEVLPKRVASGGQRSGR